MYGSLFKAPLLVTLVTLCTVI